MIPQQQQPHNGPPLCRNASKLTGCTNWTCTFTHPNRPLLCKFWNAEPHGCTRKGKGCEYFHPEGAMTTHTSIKPVITGGNPHHAPRPHVPVPGSGSQSTAQSNNKSIGGNYQQMSHQQHPRFVNPRGLPQPRGPSAPHGDSNQGHQHLYASNNHSAQSGGLPSAQNRQTHPPRTTCSQPVPVIDYKKLEELYLNLTTFDIARLPSSMIDALMNEADRVVNGMTEDAEKKRNVDISRLSKTGIKLLGKERDIAIMRRDLCAFVVGYFPVIF